jgi:hypothetical protein
MAGWRIPASEVTHLCVAVAHLCGGSMRGACRRRAMMDGLGACKKNRTNLIARESAGFESAGRWPGAG